MSVNKIEKTKKFKLKVNDLNKIEELLQNLHDEVCMNINEIQLQINKIANSVNLNDEHLESKAKYAKAMNDFMTNKDRAIGRKLDIAKLLAELHKKNGNVEEAVNEHGITDWDKLKDELVDLDDTLDTKSRKVNEYHF